MKYGVHFRSWDGLFSIDRLPAVMEQAKTIGAETFELFPPQYVFDGDTAKIKELRRRIEPIGLELLLTCKYPVNMDIASEDPEERRAGIEYMKQYIRGAAELGSHEIGGIVYSVWPHRFDDDMIDKKTKYDRTMRSIESLRQIMPTAEELDVRLNAEILNRFEHYMLNTTKEGVTFCRQVESDHFNLLLDVFHMNIEEDDLAAAIVKASGKIVNVHSCDNNRKLPGMGHINWREVLLALRLAGYDGALAMECFSKPFGVWTNDHRLWREYVRTGIDEDLVCAMQFLKGLLTQMNI